MTSSNPFCFLCLTNIGASEEDDGFGLYIQFLQFATTYLNISSTILDPFIANSDNRSKFFCKSCKKIVQDICKSYLELLQVQLRLSWKLGELEKLLESSQTLDSEKVQTQKLADYLGVPDVTEVEMIRELLSVRCEHKSQIFQPQLVLKRLEALPVSLNDAVHSQSDPNIKKEVEHSPEDSENDWNPSGEDDIASNADEPSPSTTASSSTTKLKVILIDTQIKMEEDDDYNSDSKNGMPESGSDSALSSEEDAEGGKSHTTKVSSSEVDGEGLKWQCCFCWMSFQTSQSQKRHVQGKHGKKGTFPCEVKGCQNTFQSHLELNAHLKSHTQQLHFCPVCSWGFIDVNILKLHELVHVKPLKGGGRRRMLCPEPNCDWGFETVSMLQDHYNCRHGVSLARFSCSECLHVSTSTRALCLHKKIHHLRKPIGRRPLPKNLPKNARKVSLYSCEVEGCSEQFKNYFKRNAHLETHSGSIKFCKDCGCGFIDGNLLKLHELTHLKYVKADGMTRGKYHCPEAGCSFQIPSIAKLQDHYNVRHGVSFKRFKCGQCDYVGASSSALRKHVKDKHKKVKRVVYKQNEGPRQCVPCGLDFNNRGGLTRHRFRFHLRKQCEICKETFTGQLELNKHLVETHPDK